MKSSLLCSCLILQALLYTACADLKGINKFAGSSCKTIAQRFPYGYSDYCFDSCYIYDNSTNPEHYPCDCKTAAAYDTAVIRESGKLGSYFTALAKLSGSADVIKVDTLGAVVTAGTYGSLTISSTEASVASGVATGIQDLLTVNFKSKHLTANLQTYGNAVDSSLAAYIRHLEALDGQTTNLIIYLNTRLIAYRAVTAPGPERFSVVAVYNQKMRELTGRQAGFKNLISQIQLIRSGYHQLVINAGDIRSKNLKQELLAFANNISYLSN
jgi:hypothetical protein